MEIVIDASNGHGFDFGRDFSVAFGNAATAAIIDGGSEWGLEIKQRQLENQTKSYHVVNTDETVSPQQTVPEYQMINNPISGNPVYQTTPSANPQLQKQLNMINRLRRSGSTNRRGSIIRNWEGPGPTIINREFIR